jgi:predicted RNA-binding Zn-ribbon protein involved in translation (DUF1610 family)
VTAAFLAVRIYAIQTKKEQFMDIQFACKHCGQPMVVDEQGVGLNVQCPKCGNTVVVPSPAPRQAAAAPMGAAASHAAPPGAMPSLEKKYKALRTIAVILKVLAVIVLVGYLLAAAISIVSVFAAGIASGAPVGVMGLGGMASALVFVIVGALSWVSIYAAAEVIGLLIDIEENTRALRIAAGAGRR